MATVANTGGPAGGTCPNMDASISPAPPKVAERKNTQVIQIMKNVNRAYKNPAGFLPVTPGNIDALATVGVTEPSTSAPGAFILLPLAAFSIHKYTPCNPPQATNVQLAPCHKPPISIVIMRLT